MTPSLYIIGSGGHAQVVADVAKSKGFRPVFITDNSSTTPGKSVVYEREFLKNPPKDDDWRIICGVGSVGKMQDRAVLLNKYFEYSSRFISIISTNAIIDESAKIGLGVFIGPGAILARSCSIGSHSIINTGAIIEHDCHVGTNTHVASGVTILGTVSIGNDVLVGGAATVLQGVSIGNGCVIGAGAVCNKSIPAGLGIWAGVPARMIKGG